MSVVADTIFALSSGRPPAAIAVVRISGSRAGAALQALMGRVPEPRKAVLARLRDPVHGVVIDEALALWFPGPNSETGEDTAELQVHGGLAVIAAVVGALGRIEGLRPAEAGEFTRRAFENGRLDLTAVEGLADLIGADTEAQRRQAYRQLKGFLGGRAETWRGRLVEALALVDARIDFSDEADVPSDLVGPALHAAQLLRSEIAETLGSAGRGERLRDGLVVAIAGPPNAGKSTLLNRIARREAAIVSPVPGTTRDVIEVHLDLGGYPVMMLDTAGIRDSDDPVEQEGVRRAKQRAAEADLLLWVQDARDASGLAGSEVLGPAVFWSVLNKIDLMTARNIPECQTSGTFEEVNNILKYEFISSDIIYEVSATSGEGMDRLLGALGCYAAEFFGAEPALISRVRHRRLLESSLSALDRALAEGVEGREDIIAEELRAAANALGRLTGRIDVEDILDAIFRDFCIGK